MKPTFNYKVDQKYIKDYILESKSKNYKLVFYLGILILTFQIASVISSKITPFADDNIMSYYHKFLAFTIVSNVIPLILLFWVKKKYGLQNRVTTILMAVYLTLTYHYAVGVAIVDQYKNQDIVMYYLIMFFIAYFFHVSSSYVGILFVALHILLSKTLTLLSDDIENTNSIIRQSFQFIIFAVMVRYYLHELYKKNFVSRKQLEEANSELEYLSYYDSLSNLLNRRRWEELYHNLVDMCVEEEKNLTVILIDIDYFKQYNDTYGHIEGDEIIKKISIILSDLCEPFEGHLGRYGGDEFIFAYKGMPEEITQNLIKSIVDRMVEENIEHKGSAIHNYLSLSCGGITVVPSKVDSDWIYVFEADKKLYEAKNARARILK